MRYIIKKEKLQAGIWTDTEKERRLFPDGAPSDGSFSDLQFYNIYGLRTLAAFGNFKLYLSTFFNGFVTFHLKTAEMYKHIAAVFIRDEAVTLLVVKPLNSTLHSYPPGAQN